MDIRLGLRRLGLSMGYTCVTLWFRGGGSPPIALFVFVSSLKLRKERRRQSSRGRPPGRLSGGHTCVPHTQDRV